MSSSTSKASPRQPPVSPQPPRRKWVDVTILIFLNFINYTDRYIFAGLVIDIQEQFQIKNDRAGLIQTVFVITFTATAPIFGYLGDRYNRKMLVAVAVVVWNAANVGCSFVTKFWFFLLLRAVFGIGQSCYTTVAPTMIGDLSFGDMRSKLLTVFFVAIPVGNGLGYIIGTQMAAAFGGWRWSARTTPGLTLINLILILLVLKDPNRGHSEGKCHMVPTTWAKDLKYLLTNKSFMFSTMGFTAICFTEGTVSWWAPKLHYLGYKKLDGTVSSHQQGTIFGIVSLSAGICGLCIGYVTTFKLKKKYPQIVPFVCGLGMVLSGPLLIATTYVTLYSRSLSYVTLFFALLFMDLNCALIMDICLCVVVPLRRSSACGLQILIGHALGDAGSPYLIGLFSDFLSENVTGISEFQALQYAYFLACSVEVLGSVFFFLNALYIVQDMQNLDKSDE